MVNPKPWPLDKFPYGCLDCQRTDRPFASLQRCTSCYRKYKMNNLDRGEGMTEPDDTNIEIGEPEEPSFDDAADVFSKERRPGSRASSVLPPGAALPLGPDYEELKEEGIPSSKPSLKDRVKDAFTGKKPEESARREPKVTRETRPGSKDRRRSIADDAAKILSALGSNVQKSERHNALGQYLQWNAPASGEVIDEAIKGTIIDRKLLQPASRAKDKVGAVGGVLGPPLLIFMIEANPAMFPTLGPLLYTVIESSLDSLLPAKKRAEARAKKRADSIREAYGDDLPPGVDPVTSMIESLFPWAFVEGPRPEEDSYDQQ